MAVLKLEPPPATDDIRELRAWANEMYEQVNFVLNNIGEDNLEADFFDKLNNSLISENGGAANGV